VNIFNTTSRSVADAQTWKSERQLNRYQKQS
jgi:hypothetical protein